MYLYDESNKEISEGIKSVVNLISLYYNHKTGSKSTKMPFIKTSYFHLRPISDNKYSNFSYRPYNLNVYWNENYEIEKIESDKILDGESLMDIAVNCQNSIKNRIIISDNITEKLKKS